MSTMIKVSLMVLMLSAIGCSCRHTSGSINWALGEEAYVLDALKKRYLLEKNTLEKDGWLIVSGSPKV